MWVEWWSRGGCSAFTTFCVRLPIWKWSRMIVLLVILFYFCLSSYFFSDRLLSIILARVAADSIVHNDGWRGYNQLATLPVNPPFVVNAPFTTRILSTLSPVHARRSVI